MIHEDYLNVLPELARQTGHVVGDWKHGDDFWFSCQFSRLSAEAQIAEDQIQSLFVKAGVNEDSGYYPERGNWSMFLTSSVQKCGGP